jgi:hypothetical protein
MGRRSLAIRHAAGWVFPRDVLEALEAIDDVPLPARCGMWPVRGGVEVEVLVRSDAAPAHSRIAEALEARGVPLRRLYLRTARVQLRGPLPLRCDLQDDANLSALSHQGALATATLAGSRNGE